MKILKNEYCKLNVNLKALPLFLLLQLFSLIAFSQVQETSDPPPVLIDSAIMVEDEGVIESVSSEEQVVNYFKPKSLHSDSLVIRNIPTSEMQSLHADNDFWYSNIEPNQSKAKKSDGESSYRKPISDHPLFQTLLWAVVIAGFIGFLVVYLRNANINLFRRNVRLSTERDGDVLTDDIYAISYGKEIEQAIAGSNFRLATRLLFLRLLRNLADKQIIQYAQDRTNLDYLMQLERSMVYKDFFRLTRHYEYSWYGQFPVDKSKFDLIRQEFDHFDIKLRQL